MDLTGTKLDLSIRSVPIPAQQRMYSVQYLTTVGLVLVDDSGNAVPIGTGVSGITALSGDVVAVGPGAVTATIQPQAVTYAKIQNVAATSILGNSTGAPATVQELTPASVRTLLALATVATSGSASDLTSGTLPAARLAGFYLVSKATDAPSNAVNLGALTSGLLLATVAAGTAAISTQTITAGQVAYGAGAAGLGSNAQLRVTSDGTKRTLALGTATGTLTAGVARLHVTGNSTEVAAIAVEGTDTSAGGVIYLFNNVGAGGKHGFIYYSSTTDTPASTLRIANSDFSDTIVGDVIIGKRTADFVKVASDGRFQLYNSSAAVSQANTVAFRSFGGVAQVSQNGGAWADISTGGAGGNVTGSFNNTEVPFANGLHSLTTDASFTFNSGTSALTVFSVNTATVSNAAAVTVSAGTNLLLTGATTRITGLTSNGFVKTSGSNGTLSVDTATYLTTASAAATYLTIASAASTYQPIVSATATRVFFSGGGSTLSTDADFVYNSTTNVLTAGAWTSATTGVTPGSYTNVSATVDAFGRITAMSSGTGGSISGLTATRVPFAASATTLTDDSDMTFVTDTLRVTKVQSTTFQGDASGGAATALYNSSADAAHVGVSTSGVEIKGDIVPSATGTYKNGTSTKIWTQIYATTHYAGTVTGFGGGNILTLQNNDASPVSSIDLTSSGMTLTVPAAGSILPAAITYHLGGVSNTFAGGWFNGLHCITMSALTASGMSFSGIGGNSVINIDDNAIGFLNTAAVTKQTIADMVNNLIPSSGSANTLEEYSTASAYAAVAQVIHDNQYYTGLKINDIINALQAYGLM